MKQIIFAGIVTILFAVPEFTQADWPQWRGPNRDGIVTDKVPLPVITKENQPEQLWVSETIPSDHDGGHGSIAVANGKVIVAIVWHRDVPTEKRQFSRRVLF